MTCTPDLRRRALAGVLAVMLAGAASGAEELPADVLVGRAQTVLRQGDAVGAAVYLERAIKAGKSRSDVAAVMGEALIAQGDLVLARDWLGPGEFSKGQEARGFRALARLERRQGNLGAAGAAYDRALQFTPDDPELWAEIGRLRYAGGEQLQAITAAEIAVEHGPANPRALEFRAELVRDQFGPLAALPWYERAIQRAPDDTDLLVGYAATLGDLGRAREMLAATRRVLDLSPGHPRALLLQAILALRGGKTAVARSLLDKAGAGADDIPAAKLVRAIAELQSGNPRAAQQPLVLLLEEQPANQPVQLLYARALFEAGDFAALVQRLSTVADRPDAPGYLVELIGRAYEAMGRRELAASWLDRASTIQSLPISPLLPFDDPAKVVEAYHASPGNGAALVGYLRYLLVSGQVAAADTVASGALAARPGSAQAQGLKGDVLLAQGRGEAALAHYQFAGRVRMDDSLLLRMAGAIEQTGRKGSSGALVAQYLSRNPGSGAAQRLAANAAAAQGNWGKAAPLLRSLVERRGGRDARLHSDLALAQLNLGDKQTAQNSAWRGYSLQRASGNTALALALVMADRADQGRLAQSLLDKAEAILGPNAQIERARRRVRPGV